MGLPRGYTIPLSPARRLICDLVHFSHKVPLVSVERRIDIAEVIAARAALVRRPSWFAIFLKAYALVCRDRPELRRSYLSFPWPRLHQHSGTVAHLAVARKLGDEDVVMALQLRRPDERPLEELDDRIRRARIQPVERFGDFRRLLRISRAPWPVRRFCWWLALNVIPRWREQFAGTFGVTGVAALGSESLHVLSPLTTTITYGVFAADGTVRVRLFFDHRVLDGVPPAMALAELEEVLRGPIVAELRCEVRRAA